MTLRFAFPVHLLTELHERLFSKSKLLQGSIPENDKLLELLETCYHASLQTAEHRVTSCAIAYVHYLSLPGKSFLRFADLSPLTVSELVRLAPVTEVHHTLIGCYKFDDELFIWGLIEHDHSWDGASDKILLGTPQQGEVLPAGCPTINIEGPGALSVTMTNGRTEVVRLREGRILAPTTNPLVERDQPLEVFFRTMIARIMTASSDKLNLAAMRDSLNPLQSLYTEAVVRMLEEIRLKQHGGSLIISASRLPKTLAYRTYTALENRALADELLLHFQALQRVKNAKPTSSIRTEEFSQRRVDSIIKRTRQNIIRGIKRVSLLAAIDGAVLLDSVLRVEAFGVRFPLFLQQDATILDARTGQSYRCDEWGMRHQSVFSVIHQSEETVGFVVSQDGGVKAIKSDQGVLRFWDGILD